MCGELEYAYTSENVVGCWILDSKNICDHCFNKREGVLGTEWIWDQKVIYMSCWIRILVEKSSSTVLLINALCGGSSVILGDWDGRPRGGTFSCRQIINSGNRHKRAGCDSKVVNLWIPKNWALNFLEQIPTWELEKNIQMPWTMIAIGCCKIWCYFGFLVWPGSSMLSIASRPFG